MAVQGVNILLRTALSRAPISLSLEQIRDSDTGVEKIITKQSTIGRIMTEERSLDWVEAAASHVVFGDVKTKNRICAVHEIENELLINDWEDGTEELIEVQSLGAGWTSWQAWGFEVIDGKRYHVRRVVVQKGTEFGDVAPEAVTIKMVYDWVE
ncbi:hypothetical protein V501_06367 [Pseudogymnoascus sp. VKM F-4519 (FW-2642)]|nr:hypothetical protein V501_06367 [Pseudogymnoascus sp. VKM F-4519 (FW-2642)]